LLEESLIGTGHWRRWAGSLALTALALSCSSAPPPTTEDSGSPGVESVVDAHLHADSGLVDSPDSGVTRAPDTGSATDAGVIVPPDAGHPADAEAVDTFDAGGTPDAWTADSGAPVIADAGRLETAPLVACQPSGACSGTPTAASFASFRRDFFYPLGPGVLHPDAFGTDDAPAYPEARIADPIHGGRVTVVGRAAVAGSLSPDTPMSGPDRTAFLVELDGRAGSALLDAELIDWIRVWPTAFDAGDPLWVMFHTRDPAFGSAGPVTVRVPSTGGDALVASVSTATTPVALSSVTTTEDLLTLIIHLKNEDARPHTISRVVVDGEDVTDTACIPTRDIAPNESLIITVPRCAPYELGAAWTVAVEYASAPPVVGAGRVIKPVFPIHAWPTGADCPFPGINDAAFMAHRANGYDTFFSRAQYRGPSCSSRSTVEAIESDFAAEGVWAMPDDFGAIFTDTSRVLARLLGDEVDNRSLAELVANQKMRSIAEETTYWSLRDPDVATYIGASRHRFTGMFAGAADIQGMDMYVAACAPHITDPGRHPPLRGSYDYLRAAHRNHRPMPTWLYTQGLGEWSAQPTPSEYRVQALSVLAAGAHGLMTFQTSLTRASQAPDTWTEMGSLNQDLQAIRHLLREGAPTGMARVTGGRAIVEAIRARDALVLIVIGLETSQEPSELRCLIGRNRPWQLATQTVDVAVDLPPDLGLADVFEVEDATVHDAASPPFRVGRTVHLPAIAIDDATAGRIFVLAADPALRADIATRLATSP